MSSQMLAGPHADHAHRSAQVGELVGRLVVTRSPAAGAQEQVLELRAAQEIGAGPFPDLPAARAAAAGRATIVVVVRAQGALRLYDTLQLSPHPGVSGAGPRVELHPLSRRGFEPVEWINVAMAGVDRTDRPEQSGTLRAGAPPIVLFMIPDSRAGDAFEAVVVHGNPWAIDARQAAICRTAIDAALGAEIELRTTVFSYFRWHNLTNPTEHELEDMNRRDFDAQSDSIGTVTLNPRVFRFPPAELGALIVHEVLHGRSGAPARPMGGTSTVESARFEGESYAFQHVLVERSHAGRAEEERLHRIFENGGGEVDEWHLAEYRNTWRLWYSVLKVLFAVADGELAGTAAPRVAGSPLVPSRARALLQEFATDAEHGSTFNAITNWPGRLDQRFACPW